MPAKERVREAALVSMFALWAGATSAWAHDLFFRAPRYVLAPRSSVVIDVLSGTFSRSENAISRDRLAELVLAGPGGRRLLDLEQWTEQDPKSTLRVALENGGTYVTSANELDECAANVRERRAQSPERGLGRCIHRAMRDRGARARRLDFLIWRRPSVPAKEICVPTRRERPGAGAQRRSIAIRA